MGSEVSTGLGSGLQRAQRFIVLAALLYRLSHLMVGLVAVFQHQRDQPVSWLVMGTATGTTALVYASAVRTGSWFSAPRVWADVLLTGCVLPFVAYSWADARQPESIAWVMLLGGSSSAMAGAALRRPGAPIAVALLVGTHAVGYHLTGAPMAVTAGHINSVVSSAVIVWVFWWYLRRQGSQLDEATAQAMRAEADRARYAERIAHHRALHDTVLATLTTIAGGSVDANSIRVRERCAKEASYLRRLIQQTSEPLGEDDESKDVGVALEQAVRSAEALGLAVTAQYHELPSVPPDVARSLADAVTEAFNNVRKHAGTGRAYLTAVGDDGHVVVTVVDRGAGFDPDDPTAGLGLRRSVHARMREIGGAAEVDSAPGEGARIELRWPG
ncbi:ATP-binding protein [Streptomyces sp. NPDC001941]|uniref:sensor histidine kinase n=1 Tax=Streptomyces sp. NPDC001941 TaxID=3154659 RepID=UPI00331D2A7A